MTDGEPIALGISLEELYDIAALSVSPETADLITGDCSGCVLVDIIVVHNGSYISELGEYEIAAYHSGFILECGY